jgi:hypothetical protein
MLRGLLHAISTDPLLLHNKIRKISIIAETKNKNYSFLDIAVCYVPNTVIRRDLQIPTNNN